MDHAKFIVSAVRGLISSEVGWWLVRHLLSEFMKLKELESILQDCAVFCKHQIFETNAAMVCSTL